MAVETEAGKRPKKWQQPNSGGVLSVAKGALGTEWLDPSPEWLRWQWGEVAKAIKSGDEDSVVAALKVIYDIAPDETLRDMAGRYLKGAA